MRNIDPFEKKRRQAMMANENRGEVLSRKVTSRREETETRNQNGDSMNPTQYLKISKESYYQEFERPKGSMYT